ncbi:phage major capsid protein [Candidatus Tisiphia endosymbiont of Ptychoptera albimana]|uniref:phage major capsid family protein n=1 Tax=Candidatus Tisiphia endosymbiont of Ptychoptera albimana TaxID=3066260 RepID=UPI00312C72B9
MISEPTSFTAGETVKWQRYLNKYPATEGWNLSYSFRNYTTGFDVAAIAEDDYYLVLLGSEITTAYQDVLDGIKSNISVGYCYLANGIILEQEAKGGNPNIYRLNKWKPLEVSLVSIPADTILFGNFADLIIGQWGVLDVLVDPYTLGTSGGIRIRVMQDVDIAVRHAESFAMLTRQ